MVEKYESYAKKDEYIAELNKMVKEEKEKPDPLAKLEATRKTCEADKKIKNIKEN